MEALRTNREELSVYKKINDIREYTLTLLEIADIFQAQGRFDEALALYRNEALPLAETHGILDGLIKIKLQMSSIRWKREDIDNKEIFDQIFEDFSHAHALAKQLGMQHAIRAVVKEFGQFLLMVGARERNDRERFLKLMNDAKLYLTEARECYLEIDMNNAAKQIEELILLTRPAVDIATSNSNPFIKRPREGVFAAGFVALAGAAVAALVVVGFAAALTGAFAADFF